MDTTDMTCLDGPHGCAGEVEMTTTPDREDGKHFPRCKAHHERRLEQAERNLELDRRGREVDPAYAGEVYEDDGW